MLLNDCKIINLPLVLRKLMLFTTLHVSDLPDIYHNKEIIEWVDEYKYLGV